MVLAKSHLDSDSEEEQPMEVEEIHAVKVLPQHRWLLEQLPALSQFSSAKKEACAIFRQVRLIISPSTKLIPPANEVCSKVMFLHASVILSTGWACVPHMSPCHTCPLAIHAPLPHTPLPRTPPHHMVNERAVRILLECILVC